MTFILCGGAGSCRLARAQDSAPMRLTLAQAIDLALKQNRDLRLARMEVMNSEHKKELAKAAYFPHIRNESSVLHVTELAGVRIPAGAFGVHDATGPIPAESLLIDQGALTSYTSGTGLTQPLSQMFKIHESVRAASSDVATARIHAGQAEDEVALKVRQLYYGLLIAQLKEQAAKEEVAASEIRNEEITSAVRQGESLNVAGLETHAALLDAKQAELEQRLQIHNLTLTLNDLLGLPLHTQLQLDDAANGASIAVPSREESIRIAEERSPQVQEAEQAVTKARAGLAAAKDAYIPDITGLARYSYQSGVPLLVHNFGTFGFTVTYDLFDGGRRNLEISDGRTLLSEAELNLVKRKEEAAVEVETAYDRIEQLQDMVSVAQEALNARMEAARLTERQIENTAALTSVRAEAQAKAASAKAAYLNARLGLSLAQADLRRILGEIPR